MLLSGHSVPATSLNPLHDFALRNRDGLFEPRHQLIFTFVHLSTLDQLLV